MYVDEMLSSWRSDSTQQNHFLLHLITYKMMHIITGLLSYYVVLKPRNTFMANFCHHLSADYVDLSDLYVDLSLIHL